MRISPPGRGSHAPGTSARLYDRKKFGMVGVRTASLSQLTVQTRHGDCNAIGRRRARKLKARSFLRDVDRPGLNLRKCGFRRTGGGPGGAATAHGAAAT